MNDSYNFSDLSSVSDIKGSYRKGDVSISDALADFERLRISALTNAAEISPYVNEVTIGPNSPPKKTHEDDEEPTVNGENKENETEESLIEDKVRQDFGQSLVLKEYETKLQESAEELFKDLVEKMIANRAESMKQYWIKQSEECERKALELKARKLQMLKELQENDNESVLKQARLDQQKSQLINQQTIENMNKILEEQNKATARFASITDSQTKICICYNEITTLMQTQKEHSHIFEKYITPINAVTNSINRIMDLCKTGSVSDNDVKQAEVLYCNLDNIRQKILNEINDLKQKEILKQKEEEEAALKKELEQKKAQEAKEAELAQAQKAAAEKAKSTGPLFYSQRNYAYYQELKQFLDNYEAQYKNLLENAGLKKFRFDCQKAVNTPVNALSSVSGSHIRDKYDKLSKLMKGQTVQVLDIHVNATQHPQGLAYCTALLAKKIVRQGDLLVSSNPEAAFPLAAVAVALWSQFPEFGKLLEANFHRQCPYLVPMFLPQKEGQTDKEFYLSRGYTYNDEGVVEKQDKFLKRMSGIFRLHCAIWIAKTPRFLNTINPQGLRYGWQWIASFINLRPEPDISATLLHDFFHVCGSEFIKHYGKQFIKIIKLISSDYFAILQNIDEGGPKTRLEVFLQNVLKTGHIQPPPGLLPPNTW